jgi:hypothetical protein
LVAAWNNAAQSSFCSAVDIINKHQLHGPRPKPLEDAMQTITHTKPVKVLPHSMPKRPAHKPASTWQPQQTTLTREEIRAIIIDQIG